VNVEGFVGEEDVARAIAGQQQRATIRCNTPCYLFPKSLSLEA
jgi:hypothetical protein